MQETRPRSVTDDVAFNVQTRQLRENTLRRDQERQIGESQMYIMLPQYQIFKQNSSITADTFDYEEAQSLCKHLL